MTPETTETRPAFTWTRRHLLGLEDLSAEEITAILDTAESFKEVSTRNIKKVPALRGKVVVLLFFEPSTRTRISFELAAKRLSADTLTFTKATSSTVKGETLVDTARNVEASTCQFTPGVAEPLNPAPHRSMKFSVAVSMKR